MQKPPPENEAEFEPEEDVRQIRIGRFLSHAGLCSRRGAAEFLETHRVVFRDQRIVDLNFQVPAGEEPIFVNNQAYFWQQDQEVYLLNKPRGYVCSHAESGRLKSIFRLLPAEKKHLFFAGRLDVDSSGLVVLSNDGDLIYRLTHPSQKVNKIYLVSASRPLSEEEIKKMLRGIFDGRDKLKADEVVTVRPATYKIHLHEGKNREIRRMFEKMGLEVTRLTRLQIGPYQLGDLAPGEYRLLPPAELANLKA